MISKIVTKILVCNNLVFSYSHWPVLIPKSKITLVHCYSQDKSDKGDCLFFIFTFNSSNLGKWCEIKMSSPINTPPYHIQRFQQQKELAKQKQNKIKSVKLDVTYSWDKFIPLSRIRAIELFYSRLEEESKTGDQFCPYLTKI